MFDSGTQDVKASVGGVVSANTDELNARDSRVLSLYEMKANVTEVSDTVKTLLTEVKTHSKRGTVCVSRQSTRTSRRNLKSVLMPGAMT